MFKPIKTSKITDDLYAGKTIMVNFYIYKIEGGLIVFDTGINSLLAKLVFKKLNLDSSKVTHIFLTHSDFDHVGALGLYKNAKIYISQKEEPLISFKKTRRAFLFNKKIKNCNFLEDNEIVKIGKTEIKLISTPGHTIGSSMYAIDDNILITGDTVSLNKNEIKNFSFIQNMNHKENINIVSNLKKEKFFNKFKIIATGHHGIKE